MVFRAQGDSRPAACPLLYHRFYLEWIIIYHPGIMLDEKMTKTNQVMRRCNVEKAVPRQYKGENKLWSNFSMYNSPSDILTDDHSELC